jgi:import receptor subunit TOM22
MLRHVFYLKVPPPLQHLLNLYSSSDSNKFHITTFIHHNTMVQVEEVADTQARAQTAQTEEWQTDAETESNASDISDISDDDDFFDPNSESIYDRVVALKDIVSPKTRSSLSRTLESAQAWASWGWFSAGSVAWVVSTSALLVGLPLALAIEDETRIVQQEREMQMQSQGQQQVSYGLDSGTGGVVRKLINSCWVDQSRDSRVSEHRDSRWGRRVIGVHVSHLNQQDLGSRTGTHVSTKLKYKQLTQVPPSRSDQKGITKRSRRDQEGIQEDDTPHLLTVPSRLPDSQPSIHVGNLEWVGEKKRYLVRNFLL